MQEQKALQNRRTHETPKSYLSTWAPLVSVVLAGTIAYAGTMLSVNASLAGQKSQLKAEMIKVAVGILNMGKSQIEGQGSTPAQRKWAVEDLLEQDAGIKLPEPLRTELLNGAPLPAAVAQSITPPSPPAADPVGSNNPKGEPPASPQAGQIWVRAFNTPRVNPMMVDDPLFTVRNTEGKWGALTKALKAGDRLKSVTAVNVRGKVGTSPAPLFVIKADTCINVDEVKELEAPNDRLLQSQIFARGLITDCGSPTG
jgi:hypothetical protein